jgi:hypothetical protein
MRCFDRAIEDSDLRSSNWSLFNELKRKQKIIKSLLGQGVQSCLVDGFTNQTCLIRCSKASIWNKNNYNRSSPIFFSFQLICYDWWDFAIRNEWYKRLKGIMQQRPLEVGNRRSPFSGAITSVLLGKRKRGPN